MSQMMNYIKVRVIAKLYKLVVCWVVIFKNNFLTLEKSNN